MKKINLLFLIVVLALSMTACKKEIVILRCDGENCSNTVEVEVKEDEIPDEDWVVFCQDCADKVLDD